MAARWPVDLELDLGSGKRASRMRKLETLLRAYSGTPAAFAVNNNAAALTLAVDTLARKRRLIVSRGEQVEIGGSFRLPEILERFAGKMVEVGTTNRTRLADYARAITRRGDVLLKVHRSNFSQQGYVEETSLAQLVELGREKLCPVIYDLGSGRFDDGMDWLQEPTLAEALAVSPAVISFSGDKVFGGPQAGIILGDAEVLAAIRKNPLARALRLDKLNLAALIETVAARMEIDCDLPTRRALSRGRDEIRELAEGLRRALSGALPRGTKLEVRSSEARSGGGAAAESSWPSASLHIGLKGKAGSRLAAVLRRGNPAVLGMLRPQSFILDLAAVDAEEIPALERALLKAFAVEAKE
jgi:L-seryl-tRNA(Ser) seleniumtransferase